MTTPYFGSALASAELSDVGRKRKNNEDSCICLQDDGVFCVADGMGGAIGGGMASEAITTTIQRIFRETPGDKHATLAAHVTLFEKAVQQASKWIKDFADEKVISQMGSTVVGVLFDPRHPGRAIAMHAGDSRLYRYRAGELKPVTADHTAAALLAAKLGRPESSLPAKYHNELVRAVGINESVELERTLVDVQSGDIFFICSDGLTKMLADSVIRSILKQRAHEPAGSIVQALVDFANEAGGKDNITIVLIKVGDLPAATEPLDDEESKTLMAPPPARDDTTQVTLRERSIDQGQTPHTSTPTDKGKTPHTPPTEQEKTTETNDNASSALTLEPTQSVFVRPKNETPLAILSLKGIIIAVAALIVVGGGIGSYRHFRPKNQIPKDLPVPVNPTPVVISTPPVLPPPAPPTWGTVVIQSDPSGAEVLVGGESKGVTPLPLKLAAGEQEVTLRYAGLESRAWKATVVSDKEVTTNIVFAYGSLVVRSEPSGAEVTCDSNVVGKTPYTNAVVAAGGWSCVLVAEERVPTNVVLRVEDHATAEATVVLARGRGMLKLSVNREGTKVWLDDVEIGALPRSVPLEAGEEHKVRAEFNGQRVSHKVSVKMNETRELALNFPEPAPVAKPPAVAVTTKPVSEEQKTLAGIKFVKLPGMDFWVGAARVTPQQYEQVMGVKLNEDQKKDDDDTQHPCVTGVSCSELLALAEKLTARLRERSGLPTTASRITLPTPQQWHMVNQNGSKYGVLFSHSGWECCLVSDGGKTEVFSANWRASKHCFTCEPFPISANERSPAIRIRLVLVP